MSSGKRVKGAFAPLLRRQNDLVGQPSPAISGSKLPTARDVLKHFLRVSKRCKSRDEAYRLIVDNVLSFWGMARIPTLQPRSCVNKLSRLWSEWRSLFKHKDRPGDSSGRKESFRRKLDIDKLWDVGSVDDTTTAGRHADLCGRRHTPRRSRDRVELGSLQAARREPSRLAPEAGLRVGQ